MSQQKLQIPIGKALLCLFLMLITIYAPLGGHARPSADGAHGVNNLLASSGNLLLQRRRNRRNSSRRPGAVITGRSYINVEGIRVPSPRYSRRAPAGASAQCGDGTYSFSRNRRGTCSRHGGVARWL